MEVRRVKLILRIRAVPGSDRTEFSAIMEDGCYKLRIKAPPVEGKANSELVRWLSREFSVNRDRIRIVSGSSGRTKIVEIADPGPKPGWFNG